MSKKPVHPPYMAKKLLSFMRHYSEEYSSGGDLMEEYRGIAKERGKCVAYLWYWWQVLYAIPTYILLQIEFGGTMFKNYFKIALRNMKKHKSFSFINISGLAIGIACFILIILYVRYEFSYDCFHENADNIYRVGLQDNIKLQKSNYFAVTEAPLGPTLMKDFPEVLNATRLRGPKDNLIQFKEKRYYESGIYADEHFFEVFSFHMISGDKRTALKEPFSIVVSEKFAQKFFGSENPLGKIMVIDDLPDVQITGIFRDVPKNSHLQFNYVLSLITLGSTRGNKGRLENWNNLSYYTYIQLTGENPYQEFEKNLYATVAKYVSEDSAQKQPRHLLPLKKIHFSNNYNFNNAVTSDISYIYLFSAIAFFILIIACFNYMNLTTARYTKRFKEVGIRKVVGAQRRQLIRQFTGESFFMTLLAVFASLLLVRMVLPEYNHFIGREITINFWHDPVIWLALLGTIGFVGLFSGSYPALFLSSFRPVQVLKGLSHTSTGTKKIRNVLVVTQFSISIVLFICTGVVLSQLKFIRHKDVGFEKEHVIIVPAKDSGIQNSAQNIRRELLTNPQVLGVSCSSATPLSTNGGTSVDLKRDSGEEVKNFFIWRSIVDYDYPDVFGIKLVDGRYFSRNYPSDIKSSVLVNETAVKRMGWKEPIGKDFSIGEIKGKIIGVIQDYHFWSLRYEIEPMFFVLNSDIVSYISIKIRPGRIEETLTFLQQTFEKFTAHHPFTFYFMDELFNNKYSSDQKLGKIFGIFSLLSLFVACLGLFGLASFTAEQRTKEIGIRKVLGASFSSITLLLTRNFTKCVLLANLISWPVAFLSMTIWLRQFAYKTELRIWLFILSGLLALTIALIAVSYQTIRTTLGNPVTSLRYE